MYYELQLNQVGIKLTARQDPPFLVMADKSRLAMPATPPNKGDACAEAPPTMLPGLAHLYTPPLHRRRHDTCAPTSKAAPTSQVSGAEWLGAAERLPLTTEDKWLRAGALRAFDRQLSSVA